MDKRQTQLKILFLAFFGWSFLFLGSSSAHASSMIIGGATGTPRDVIFSGLVKASSSMGILTAADPTYNLKINQSLYFPSGTLIQNGNMTVDYINDLANPVAFLDLSSSETSLSAAGNLSTAGNIFSSGLGNNYFLGNVGIGLSHPMQYLTIADPSPLSYSEKRGFLSVDNILFSSLHGGMYFGRVGVTENQWSVTGIPTDWRQNSSTPLGNWNSVAMSSDGRFQTAGDSGGYIYYSTDSGVTWRQSNIGGYYWLDIAMSSDGKIQVAASGERIYYSSDYGVNWRQADVYNQNWTSVAMSSDGKVQIAATNGGYIYVSTDYGAHWKENYSSGARNWTSVAMSSDGKIQAATDDRGIFYSTDYGLFWERSFVGNKILTSIAMSSDGKIQVAASGERIYYSSDYGAHWLVSNANHGANGVAVSSDGRIQAAVANGTISYSTNYGADWEDYSYTGDFRKIAISSDGKVQTVAPRGADYLSTSYGGSYNLGRVGIGTSNPKYNLDVEGSVNFSGDIYFNGYPFVGWSTNGSNIYYPSGNVGIGNTTNPQNTLEINVPPFSWNSYDLTVSNGSGGIAFSTNGSYTEIWGSKNIALFSNNGSGALVLSNSKVGVGSLNIPSYILDGYTEGGDGYYRFGAQSSPQNVGLTLSRGGINQWYMYSPANTTDLRFSALNVTDPFTIKNTTGNVGIGTTNPAEKLDVFGKIAVNGRSLIHLPNQTNFTGTIYFGNGNGGANLAWSGLYQDYGKYNTLVGVGSGQLMATGSLNTALGYNTLSSNVGGSANTALGYNALAANYDGGANTAVGKEALFSNFSGDSNTGVGLNALSDNMAGSYNVAVGRSSLERNINGDYNIGLGERALMYNLSGSKNIAVGERALYYGTSSSYNIAIGYQAGQLYNRSGDYNIFIGQSAGTGGKVDVTNSIAIGRSVNPTADYQVTLGSDSILTTILKGKVGIGITNPTAATLVIATSSGNYSFDAGAFRIGNLGTPVLGTDGATKSYVDSSISNNIFSISRRSVSDADTSIASTTDRLVVYTSISAPRTVTIPTDVCTTGRILTIGDESGSVSLTNTITVTPTSGSISGTSTLVINEPYNNVSIYCKGSGNSWFIY